MGGNRLRCTASRKGQPSHRRIGVAVRSTCEHLEQRHLLAAVSWDGGGNGTSWTDPLNWSTNALPGVDDDVTIDVVSNPTITLSTGTQAIRSLISVESVSFSGGTLIVAGASSISSLTLSGGTLTGSGDLTVTGQMSWTSGTMLGSGKTIMVPGTTSSVGSVSIGRRFDNYGTLTLVDGAGMLGSGGETFEFNNHGTVVMEGNSPTGVGGSGDHQFGNSFPGPGVSRFNNYGVLTKNGASRTIFDNIPGNPGRNYVAFANAGTINLNAGTLVRRRGTHHQHLDRRGGASPSGSTPASRSRVAALGSRGPASSS